MVPCDRKTVHSTCVASVTELHIGVDDPDTILGQLEVIIGEGYEVFIVDVALLMSFLVVDFLITAIASLGIRTMLLNVDGLLDQILLPEHALLLENSVVFTPQCPADLRIKYGASQCGKVGNALDALEVAVRAAVPAADVRALSPIKAAVSGIAFTGATGPVAFADGRRVNQTWDVYTVASGTQALQEFGTVVGSEGGPVTKTSTVLWRGKARQGPAIGHTLHTILLDDDRDDGEFFGYYARAVEEHNADVVKSFDGGALTGGALVLNKVFTVTKHSKHELDTINLFTYLSFTAVRPPQGSV